MKTINVTELRKRFSAYVAMARRGVRVRILKDGVPVADLVPVAATEDGESVLEESTTRPR